MRSLTTPIDPDFTLFHSVQIKHRALVVLTWKVVYERSMAWEFGLSVSRYVCVRVYFGVDNLHTKWLLLPFCFVVPIWFGISPRQIVQTPPTACDFGVLKFEGLIEVVLEQSFHTDLSWVLYNGVMTLKSDACCWALNCESFLCMVVDIFGTETLTM